MSDIDLIDDDSSVNLASPFDYSFLNNLDLDQDVIRRLSLQLSSIEKGNSEVYTTPLAKERDPQSILKGWDEVVQSNSHLMNDPLIDLELSNRSKFGPRSIALPWKERISSVDSYFDRESSFSIPHFDIVRPVQSLRPISLDSSINLLKNNTNSGLPYFTKKKTIKPYLASRIEDLLLREDPCLLFTRTQEGGKTRTVWGYPIAETAFEMMYYSPLLKYQRLLDWRAAIRGPEEIDIWVTRLLDFARSNNLEILSIDFTTFDAKFVDPLIYDSFRYVKSLFQSRYHKDIDRICDRFNNIGLVTPDGVKTGRHGVPSGSTFTNEIDSIGQYLIARGSGLIFDGAFQIQGDDGIYALRKGDSNKLISKFESAGLDVNKGKSYISNDYCVYLQCLHHPDYRNDSGIIGGVYPTYRALNRLLYQERWSDFMDFGLLGKDYYSIRTISILENCKHHPLFKLFVKYIVSLDKYSLSYSKESVSKYYDMLSNSSGSWGTIYNQYGDDVKGIASFDTVKVINSIA